MKSARPLWIAALLYKGLSPTERIILVYLGWRQGGNGDAWPSQSTIAANLGLTTEGVRKIVNRLETKGRLKIVRPAHTAPGQRLRYCVNTQTTVGANTPTGVGANDNNNTPTAGGANTPTAKPRHIRRTLQGTHQIRGRARGASPVHRPKAREEDTVFARFWSAYPKKVAKVDARRAWAKLRPDAALVERIIAGVERYAGTEGWTKDGGRFIPHPATFLNKRRWDDEIEPSGVAAALGCVPCGEDEAKQLLRDAGLWKGDE